MVKEKLNAGLTRILVSLKGLNVVKSVILYGIIRSKPLLYSANTLEGTTWQIHCSALLPWLQGSR